MSSWVYLLAGGGLFALALLLLWMTGNKPSFIPDFPINIMQAAKRQSLDTFLQKPRKKVVKGTQLTDQQETFIVGAYEKIGTRFETLNRNESEYIHSLYTRMTRSKKPIILTTKQNKWLNAIIEREDRKFKAELQEDHRERALQEGYTPPEMKRAINKENLIPIRFESDTFRYKAKYIGGKVKKPYVCLISGTDPKWGLKREFIKIKKVKTDYNPSKYTSILETELQEGTILEARNSSYQDRDWRSFFLVVNGAGKYTEGMKKNMLRIGNPNDPESINEIKELLYLSPKERIARAMKEGKLQMECWEHGRRTGDIYGGFSSFEMIEVGSGDITKHGAYLLEQEKATKSKIAKLRKEGKLTPGRELRISRRVRRHKEEMEIRKLGID